MGAIWLDRDQLLEFLTEVIGTKLGLVVGNDDLDQFLATRGLAVPSTVTIVPFRMRSEEVEELTRVCLQHFGDPDATHVSSSPLVSLSVLGAFKDFPHTMDVMSFAIAEMEPRMTGAPGNSVGVDDILSTAEERWGATGLQVAERFFLELNARLFTSPWTKVARTEYHTRIELRDLFTSRRLPTTVEQFFDQRFVNYLGANGDDITKMHWRQFEGLVAEALVRAGFKVEIGPGSNDDGVDVRAWDPDEPDETPALLLVQCKREKEKVGKVVVKALAADVAFEGARVGLVATTSAWSPGARETVRARSYPLLEAEGAHVRQWIRAMRTPGAGPWLAG